MKIEQIEELLGNDRNFLEYECKGVTKDRLHLPGPDFIERVLVP